MSDMLSMYVLSDLFMCLGPHIHLHNSLNSPSAVELHGSSCSKAEERLLQGVEFLKHLQPGTI